MANSQGYLSPFSPIVQSSSIPEQHSITSPNT